MLRRVALLLAVIPALAVADPITKPTKTEMVGQHAVDAQTATVLYFNRCVGGCNITTSNVNDARTHASTIACRGQATCAACPSGTCNVPEFHPIGADTQQQRDQIWNDLMTCLKEVYSPYNVTITDVQPAAGVAYNENIVAGLDSSVGYGPAGGVSPVTNDCSPFSYVISYSFANGYDNAFELCYVAAQETGHAYGMADHSYSFISDGSSACSDPMSYRVNCLAKGQRFFRNQAANCGDFSQAPCNCAGMNSHAKLLAALGAGQSIIPPPTVSVTSPTGGMITAATPITVTAASKRGVSRVELLLNGYKWAEAKGNAFGATGQLTTPYSLMIPEKVPNSVIDIEVSARDDLGATTMSQKVRVTKGAACSGDASCGLPGMRCDGEGRCLWDPPVGELGDECTYNEYCKSGSCVTDSTGESLCSQACVAGSMDSCPMGYECLATGGAMGSCWPKSEGGGGCCSSNRDALAQTGLLGLGLAFVLGRRRRRK